MFIIINITITFLLLLITNVDRINSALKIHNIFFNYLCFELFFYVKYYVIKKTTCKKRVGLLKTVDYNI